MLPLTHQQIVASFEMSNEFTIIIVLITVFDFVNNCQLCKKKFPNNH
jgi:hypothetical protein